MLEACEATVFQYWILSTYRVLCLAAQSCPTSGPPWTVAHQAPLSMGFSRQEYWSGLPCPPPGDLPNLEIESRSPYYRWILYCLSPQGGSPLITLSYIVTDPFYFLYFTGFWIGLKNPESFSFPLVEEIRVQCSDLLLSKLRYPARQVFLLGKTFKGRLSAITRLFQKSTELPKGSLTSWRFYIPWGFLNMSLFDFTSTAFVI